MACTGKRKTYNEKRRCSYSTRADRVKQIGDVVNMTTFTAFFGFQLRIKRQIVSSNIARSNP